MERGFLCGGRGIPFTVVSLFTDLGNVEWARVAIINLANAGVINGYGDGTFKPENNITRAEFAKMLVVAFDIYDPNATSSFTNLLEGEWYKVLEVIKAQKHLPKYIVYSLPEKTRYEHL